MNKKAIILQIESKGEIRKKTDKFTARQIYALPLLSRHRWTLTLLIKIEYK